MNQESPFVPGARVAIQGWRENDYREGFVEKVHKSGNFTLRGSKRQWRPSPADDYSPWSAWQTGGDSWGGRSRLIIWDDATDQKISEAKAKADRCNRHLALAERFSKLREGELTDAMLAAVEAALPPRQ